MLMSLRSLRAPRSMPRKQRPSSATSPDPRVEHHRAIDELQEAINQEPAEDEEYARTLSRASRNERRARAAYDRDKSGESGQR